MGLKNKHSLFDLVKGTDPVGKMETEPIKPFQPSTTEASNKHIESLQKVPGPPQNSPHQDLNGAPGPQFQLPTAQASQKHINSLQQVPGGTENSQHQDLNGVPDPNYNTHNGTKDSPFSSGDHMIDLLTQKIQSTNTNQTYEPSPNQSPHQDLDGELGPQSQLPTAQASQKHIDSLQSVPGGDSNSPFQDLDGVPGPQFQLPTGDASQAHIDSLQQVPGPPQNSPHQDLDGNPGPTFDLGDTSTLQQNSLLSVPGGDSNSPFQDLNGNAGPKFDTGKPTQVHADPNQKTPTELVANYTSKVNPDANYGNSQWPVVPAVNQDLDGQPGPGFANIMGEATPNVIDTIAEQGLKGIYTSTINPLASYGAGQPKGTWPSVNPSKLDLDGKDGQLFDMGRGSLLKQDLLANIYQSGVNPGASYGAGQPGGTWPSVNPSPLLPAGYADLDGIKPTGYQNPDTGVQY